jgi:hypothetical protein
MTTASEMDWLVLALEVTVLYRKHLVIASESLRYGTNRQLAKSATNLHVDVRTELVYSARQIDVVKYRKSE